MYPCFWRRDWFICCSTSYTSCFVRLILVYDQIRLSGSIALNLSFKSRKKKVYNSCGIIRWPFSIKRCLLSWWINFAVSMEEAEAPSLCRIRIDLTSYRQRSRQSYLEIKLSKGKCKIEQGKTTVAINSDFKLL